MKTDPPSWAQRVGPVALVVAVLIVVWYAAAVWLNAPQVIERLNGIGNPWGAKGLIGAAWSMERPVLPAPHQIVADWWTSVFEADLDSPRSLVYHAGVTLSSTLVGFALGMALGVLIAIGVVHSRVLDRGLLPWIIASQTIPIIALAPMIVVIMNQFDVTGVVPKATISAYLSFFPVTVGMVKGLRSPDPLQLDLMRTYSASRLQTFFKLRAPASVPFLFTSLKVAVAASLVGAVVAEMTKSEDGGFGARLLAGSYYGQTIQIWAALFAAAFCAAMLVMLVGIADRAVSKRMGYVR